MWSKSSCSFGANSNCVEVEPRPGGGMLMRDSKDPGGPVLAFTEGEWGAFIAGVKDNEFDDLAAG